MNLFEISNEIQNVVENFEVDERTGEVFFDEEKLKELQMAQAEKRKNIALLIKNLTAEIDELKVQEYTFKNRREQKEKKRDWLKQYLTDDLNGESFECAEVAVKSKLNPEKVVWDKDEEQNLILWLKAANYGRAIKTEVKESVIKSEIKDIIANGEDIPMASIVREKSITIK